MLCIWQNLDSMCENPITIIVLVGMNTPLLIIVIELDKFVRIFLVLMENT
jgi:hypothetical protein